MADFHSDMLRQSQTRQDAGDWSGGYQPEHPEPCSYIEGFPGENESRKRGVEFNPDYEIREYSAGDELKNIHWKLSAKQGEMMVRERLSAGREKINVLLPLHLTICQIKDMQEVINPAFFHAYLKPARMAAV